VYALPITLSSTASTLLQAMTDPVLAENSSIVFTRRSTTAPDITIHTTLSLTADERTKTRRYVETDDGLGIYLRLPRGTVLKQGDVLTAALEDASESSSSLEEPLCIQVIAKPEPVMTVMGKTLLDLMKAAYHLGNRHVPVEVTPNFLRLSPDPVLKHMLLHMGLTVIDEVVPFEPEVGAYGHSH
jgi:urease accessory protein